MLLACVVTHCYPSLVAYLWREGKRKESGRERGRKEGGMEERGIKVGRKEGSE